MNILFAFADDWGRYAGAYAGQGPFGEVNQLVKTPHFDRVAEEGVRFDNALVPAPSCTPCRSSLLSGRYFWQTGLGAILLGAVWDSDIPTFPLELEKSGYHIGHTYKVWSPGKSYNAPYGGRRTSYEAAGTRFNRFSHEAVNDMKETGVETAKESLLSEVRGNFQSFLDSRPKDAPFCYWWGPTNTHRTWEKGSGKTLWGMDPDALSGKLPSFLPDVPEVREDFNDYLGECQAVDAGLGVLLNMLEEIGELESTLIVVSGDHGIPGMPRAKCNLYDIGLEVPLAIRCPEKIEGGRVIKDFVNLMDLAPTLLEAASVPAPEGMVAKSLWPLLTGTGSGWVEPERDAVVAGRERHVDTAREGMLPYPQRSIRTKEYLYIKNFMPDRWPMGDPGPLENGVNPIPYELLEADTHVVYADMDAGPTKAWMVWNREAADCRDAFDLAFGKRPEEELYCLADDPNQLVNLANQEEHAALLETLRERLMTVLKEQQDPRVIEEKPCRFEQTPYAGPQQDFQRSSFGWE